MTAASSRGGRAGQHAPELGKADEVFLTSSAAEVTPVGEIIGEIGQYRFTPGTICRLMWEDYDRAVGKNVAATAA
jgi:branched-chain amino acid aminotransferase